MGKANSQTNPKSTNNFEEKGKKQLTKAFLHDRINKSSGEGHKK